MTMKTPELALATELVKDASDHYHSSLLECDRALGFLADKGLELGVIKTLEMGFCDRSFIKQLSGRNSKQGKHERQVLSECGWLGDTGRERFEGAVLIPCIEQGAIVGVYGHKVAQVSKLREGSEIEAMVWLGKASLWNWDNLSKSQEVIICDDYFEALYLYQLGFEQVTVVRSEEQLKRLTELNIQSVILALDNTDTINAYQSLLTEMELSSHRLLLDNDYSLGRYLRVQAEPYEAFVALLMAKRTLMEFCPVREPGTRTQALLELTDRDGELHCDLEEVHYRMASVKSDKSGLQIKVGLEVSNEQGSFFDVLDLNKSTQRKSFAIQAMPEVGVSESVLLKQLGQLRLRLEIWLNQSVESKEDTTAILSEFETNEAMAFLTSADWVERVLEDYAQIGLVGERENKLVAYLAMISRKLSKPLAVLVQSSSAAGKSSLLDATLDFVPPEDKYSYSAMTSQSVYYMGAMDLAHKVLSISEEEGASQASYALKLLQSEGDISISTTKTNKGTGNHEAECYRVKGPVALAMTTTADTIDEELRNRCLVLTVDEGQAQTQAIHQAQRHKRTLDGLVHQAQKRHTCRLHHNAQRLLKPYQIVNHFAPKLTFASHQMRTRRDHEKYLTLIDSIAFFRQHQKSPHHVQIGDRTIEYLEVELCDIELANRLSQSVLGRSLDELPPVTRNLLRSIEQYVNTQMKDHHVDGAAVQFTRRDIQQFAGMGHTASSVHLKRLVQEEYLIKQQTAANRPATYQLIYSDSTEQGTVCGLVDVSTLETLVQVDGCIQG